ncbi:MAG: hypothetical protein AB7K64_11165 [Variibacter sp.]
MSSIFGHDLRATFRDRAYASLGGSGTFRLAAAFAVGVALTAMALRPVPDEARAAWAGGSTGVNVQAVNAQVAERVAALKQRRAVEAAAAAKIAAEDAKAAPKPERLNVADAAPAQPVAAETPSANAGAADAPATTQAADVDAAIPMPSRRPTAAELARADASRRAAAAERKRIARAREERRREMAARDLQSESYPAPHAYRVSDGRAVRVYPRGAQPPRAESRVASRNLGPLGGLLGLFGVAD